MRALQYVYTSWKNGDSFDKGYMIYSRSNGITDEECDCIKEIMQYMPPKGLKMNPTPEEIVNDFPYNFAYFALPSGRVCIANATYLGKDYSGRFGNYIIYALVFEYSELTTYPVELFAESYMKTTMTGEELNATPPVPPLPPININDYGSVVNDDVISEFINDREENFSWLISALLEGIRLNKPVYINDTRENLVLWMAAIQKILPLEMAKKFYFATYIGNQDNIRLHAKSKLLCIGVRPDANYFDYVQEKQSSRHIVLDFLNDIKTENIRVSHYAIKMSEYFANALEQLNQFKAFLETTKYITFDEEIITAFEFYRLLDKEGTIHKDRILDLISFGKDYCRSSDNTVVATKMLNYFQKNISHIDIQNMKIIFSYTFQYAGHMLSMIYSVLYDTIFESVGVMTLSETSRIHDFFNSCKHDLGVFISGYYDYFTSEEAMNAAKLYLNESQNQVVVQYYLSFILENYDLSHRTNSNKPLFTLFHTLLNKLYKMGNATENVLAVLQLLVSNADLYVQILSEYVNLLTNGEAFDNFFTGVAKQLYTNHENLYEKIERVLIQNSEYNDTATALFAKRIALSRTPESVFEHYRAIASGLSKAPFDLEMLIGMYLSVLNEDKRFQAVLRLFGQLGENVVRSKDILLIMIEIIEKKEITELAKVDMKILSTIDSLCRKMEVSDDIIYAVIYGEMLVRFDINPESKYNLLKRVETLNLTKLSRKSYEIYLERYLEPILSYIHDDITFGYMLTQFYHKKHFDILSSTYIRYLRDLDKRKDDQWGKAVIYSCTYAIKNNSTPIAMLFEPYLVEYLHKIKTENMDPIQKHIEIMNLGSYSTTFFIKIQKGEKRKGFLSEFFKKS